MIEGQKILGLIPARGGSKRLPKKHLLPFGDVSLITHSIRESSRSKYLDSIVVSTDCEEIAGEAARAGALVPFLRPAELATDTTSSMEVVLHALTYLQESKGEKYDIVILLQPTSPFRTGSDIDKALKIFLGDPRARSLVSVVKAKNNPAWLHVADEDGHLAPLLPPTTIVPPERVYCRNGALYMTRTHTFLEHKTFYVSPMAFYEMSEEDSIDIDEQQDMDAARTSLKKRQSD